MELEDGVGHVIAEKKDHPNPVQLNLEPRNLADAMGDPSTDKYRVLVTLIRFTGSGDRCEIDAPCHLLKHINIMEAGGSKFAKGGMILIFSLRIWGRGQQEQHWNVKTQTEITNQETADGRPMRIK